MEPGDSVVRNACRTGEAVPAPPALLASHTVCIFYGVLFVTSSMCVYVFCAGFLCSPSQPPFYSENVSVMYDLIQTAPLRFPSFLGEDTRSILIGVSPSERLLLLGPYANVATTTTTNPPITVIGC